MVGFGQPVAAEPILVSGELAAAAPLTAPQSELFSFGAAAALAIHYPLAPALLIGMRLQGGILSSGDPPTRRGLRDPGAGTFELASLSLRLRPLGSRADVRRATGPFIDLGLGGGVTGELGRAGFGGGIGYGIAIGDLSFAPVLRYLQVLQPTTVLASDDARLLTLGIEVTFSDARPQSAKPPPPRAKPAEHDRDHDGITDPSDKCPDRPEDMDGHDDADGCPDPDNDGDGVLDAKDACPNDAEDFDDFEDADGCPEPDNDLDGFLDADDQCPNEAEVVNGNKDFDGCPDKGLIVFENDRIVLEERVLFDFERARVKSEARPILHAIIELKNQHPEWLSLRIEGHADARGNAEFNQELSERRAGHVMAELIKLGIPAEQIRAIGFGATHLRDLRGEEEAHQRNRRVEFVVEARVPGKAPAEDESAGKPASDRAPPAAPPAKPKALAPSEEKKPAEIKAAPSQEKKPAAGNDKPAPPALEEKRPAAARDKPASLLTPIGPQGAAAPSPALEAAPPPPPPAAKPKPPTPPKPAGEGKEASKP
jgi:outer membrane protein OmpA-like peptidoglycan-associated protein